MKTLLCLLSLAGLLTLATGCEIDEHRGGYWGPHEYGYGHDWDHHDWDHDHDGHWDRGHYYHD